MCGGSCEVPQGLTGMGISFIVLSGYFGGAANNYTLARAQIWILGTLGIWSPRNGAQTALSLNAGFSGMREREKEVPSPPSCQASSSEDGQPLLPPNLARARLLSFQGPQAQGDSGGWEGQRLSKNSGKLDVVILRPQAQAKDLSGKATFRSGIPVPDWSCSPRV